MSGQPVYPRCANVAEAIDVLRTVIADQQGGDSRYFESQLDRFRCTASRIHELCPSRARILDVGSHYLHQAGILRLLGHEVNGVDVPVFSMADFVVERSRLLDIPNFMIASLEDGCLLVDERRENAFDVVVFTAILEHITFNPVRFWRRVYDLLRPGGKIYLTTPNSLRPIAMVRHLRRLLQLEGAGIPVKDVLTTVTYGHHWKEYSRREIVDYFQRLSPDFHVDAGWYDDDAGLGRDFKSRVRKALSIVPMFRPEIEAIVSLPGKSGRFMPAPELPLTKATGERT